MEKPKYLQKKRIATKKKIWIRTCKVFVCNSGLKLGHWIIWYAYKFILIMSSLKKNSKPSKVARVAKYLKTKVSPAFVSLCFLNFCYCNELRRMRVCCVCVLFANLILSIVFGKSPTAATSHWFNQRESFTHNNRKNRLNANRFAYSIPGDSHARSSGNIFFTPQCNLITM